MSTVTKQLKPTLLMVFWLKILEKVSERRWEKTFNFKINVQKHKVEIQSWKIKKVLDRGNVLVAKNLENQVDRVAELRGVSNTSTYGTTPQIHYSVCNLHREFHLTNPVAVPLIKT